MRCLFYLYLPPIPIFSVTVHTIINSSGFDAVFKPWNRVYMALLTSILLCTPRTISCKNMLTSSSTCENVHTITDILWDIKRSVFFMGYVVIVWYQISFEPGWLRLFQSGVALLHIKAIKYLYPPSHTYFHIGRESGIHTWIFWPTAIKQGLPTDL